MSYETYVLSQSPRLYIPWTETSGNTFADLTGNGHDATPPSGIVAAGGIDGVIRGHQAAIWNSNFTNFGNVTTIPNRGPMTWLIWFRVPPTGFNWYRMSIINDSDFFGSHFLIYLASQTISVPYYYQFGVIGPGGNGFSIHQIDNVVVDCWHQFVTTWDGSTLLVYRDGSAWTPLSFGAPTPSIWNTPRTPDTLSISDVSGNMDVNHFAVYNRALSGADVAADYAAAVPLNNCVPIHETIRLTHAPGVDRIRYTLPYGKTGRLVHNG